MTNYVYLLAILDNADNTYGIYNIRTIEGKSKWIKLLTFKTYQEAKAAYESCLEAKVAPRNTH